MFDKKLGGNQLMKCLLENIILFLLKMLNFFRKRKGVALLSSPVPETNLGDQALLIGAITGIQKLSQDNILILKNSSIESPKTALKLYPEIKNIEFDEDSFLVFVTPQAFKDRIKLLFKLASYQSFFIIGADILDGSYGGHGSAIRKDIITKLNFLGVKCTILGSSLSEKVTAEAKDSLTTIDVHCHLFARDKYSFQRMQQLNIKSQLSADIAFLMNPKADLTLASFYGRHADTECLIGLCLKDSDLGENGQYEERYLILINRLLAKPDVTLVMLPHHPSDLLTIQGLVAKLSPDVLGRVLISNQLPSAADVKSLSKACDLVITGRMHVAIASLGSGTSVLCIPYGNKFEGLLSHFELDEEIYILSDKALSDIDSVYKKVEKILANLSESENIIKDKLNDVKQLSLKNLVALNR